jgi:predicted DNA-binding antitoxin AbrB/MazE fold protein
MGIRVRAMYEGKALRPLREIELGEGEEVEIEIKKSPVDEFHGKMKIQKEIADEIIDIEMWD